MASNIVDRVASVRSSIAIKAPCRVTTTANITLSGEQTIDGVAVTEGERVLVKDQTTGSENGIYIVSTGAWRRAPDWDGSGDVVTGTLVRVTAGTSYVGSRWTVSTTGTITIGTTSVTIVPEAVEVDLSLSDFQQAGTGAIVRTALAKMRDVIAVTDFDVDKTGGDDSTAGFQSAIDAVATTGGRLLVPDGTYDIASGLVLDTSFVTIEGEGAGSIINYTGTSGDWLTLGVTSGRSHIGLKNIQLQAQTPASLTGGYALVVYGGSQFELENVRIDDPYNGVLIHSTNRLLRRNVQVRGARGQVAHHFFGDSTKNCEIIYDRDNLAGLGNAPDPGTYIGYWFDGRVTTYRSFGNQSIGNPTYGYRATPTQECTVTGVSGTFQDGETVTASGGGTGVYRSRFSTASVYNIGTPSGTFSGTLTGGTSGATATISSVTKRDATYLYLNECGSEDASVRGAEFDDVQVLKLKDQYIGRADAEALYLKNCTDASVMDGRITLADAVTITVDACTDVTIQGVRCNSATANAVISVINATEGFQIVGNHIGDIEPIVASENQTIGVSVSSNSTGGLVAFNRIGNTATGVANASVNCIVEHNYEDSTNVSTPAAISANQNNYALANTSVRYLRVTAAADYDFTGFAGGFHGRRFEIINYGSNTFTLKHESTSSTDINRIVCVENADVEVPSRGVAQLWYDGTTQRWRVMSSTGATGSVAKLDVENQVLSGGVTVTSKSLTAGSFTVDPGDRPLQYITNSGAFTITAPAADGSCVLLVTNDGSAGAITFSGFTVGSTGDALTTTNGHRFAISITRVNSISFYSVQALQ